MRRLASYAERSVTNEVATVSRVWKGRLPSFQRQGASETQSSEEDRLEQDLYTGEIRITGHFFLRAVPGFDEISPFSTGGFLVELILLELILALDPGRLQILR